MSLGARIENRIRRLFGGANSTPPPTTSALPPSFERFKDYIRVHPSAIIGPGAAVNMFNPPSEPRVCLEIGEGCHIFSTFSLLRPLSTIRVGRNCQLGASQFIAAERIEIGDDVLMAWGATIIDTDTHALSWHERKDDVANCRRAWNDTNGQDISRYHKWDVIGTAPVNIGSKSWIGFNVAILKGVEVGEGVIVGAGSVVTRSLDPWTKAAGNPCRVVGRLEQPESEASDRAAFPKA